MATPGAYADSDKENIQQVIAGQSETNKPSLGKDQHVPTTKGEFSERLHRLCASGKIPVYRQRVAVVGPYGVGKTHLVKHLIQEKYDEENDANTRGVNIQRCIVHKAGRSYWIRGKDSPEDQFVQNMAIGIQKLETFGDPVKMDQTPSAESLTDVEESRGMMANRDPTPGGSKSSASPDQAVERDYLKNIDPELLVKIEKMAQGEPLEPEKQITIWDFGGQDVNNATHQTFLSDQIIYLLVFRLDVDLDEKIPVYRGEKTVKESIMFWLNSIDMHIIGRLREDRSVIPHVLIIGTHKDMLGSQDEAEKIFGKLKECLDDKQVLKNRVYRCFAISNLAEADMEFDEIKRTIEVLCGYSSDSEATVQMFPVSWIQLEMDLAKKSEDDPIITAQQLREMAQRVGLSDKELRNIFIPYHHRQGDILYFKADGLENVVIIDPVWLAYMFSAIMTPASIHSGCTHVDLLKEDLKRGVLKEEVFDEYLKATKMTEIKAVIIQLMLHFDLMVELSHLVENRLLDSGKRTFLVPSMLASNYNRNVKLSEMNPQKYLLIAFPHISFPTGLFHRLIVRLLRKYKAQRYENNIPFVGFDRASFRLEDKCSVLHLIMEDKAIRLMITNATGIPPKPQIYLNARKAVEGELSTLRNTYCPRMHFGYSIRVKNDRPSVPIEPQDAQSRDVIGVSVEDSEEQVDLRPFRVFFSVPPPDDSESQESSDSVEVPPPDDSESHGSPDIDKAPPPDDSESHGSPDSDEGFMEKFKRLCESGKIPVYRQRVAVVGPYGVGKTHLVKRLIQAVYDKECDANTPGVKIYRHRCIVREAGRSNWSEGEGDPEHIFAQSMAIGLQKPETQGYTDQVNPAPSSENQPHLEDVNRKTISLGDSGSHVSSGRRAEKRKLKTVDHKILSAMESKAQGNYVDQFKASPFGGSESDDSQGGAKESAHLKNIDPELLGKIKKMAQGEPVEPEKQITIWDFGGQDVYYTTHQTFLSEQIVYLLVFRLDVDLDEKIPVYRGEKTVKDFIMFWLNSIHMHTTGKLRKEDQKDTPYVLLIGTHRDMLGPKVDVEKIFDKVKRCLKDKQVLKNHVYQYFAISNLATNDEGFAEIKNTIEKLCGYSSDSEATIQKFPVSWIQLEMDLAKKSKDDPIITVQQLCEMGQKVGLSDEELQDNFIPYHHHQGDMLHFKVDGLKNVVIIDPLWLAGVFSAIMAPTISHPGGSHSDFLKEDLKRGVLKEGVFDEYLKEIKMHEKKTEIIQLMLHFNLMLELSDKSVKTPLPGPGKRIFLVPSMLASNCNTGFIHRARSFFRHIWNAVVSKNSANPALIETDPHKYLLIAFPHILFPTGLFHRLIICLLRKYGAGECENNIEFDRASIRLEDKQSFLHLVMKDMAMKLFISNATGNPPEPHIYSNARKTVEDELSTLRNTYCPSMHFGYCVRIKNDGPSFSIKPQDVKSRGEICVRVEGSEVSVDLKPYRVWFQDVNQDSRADRCPENEYKNESEPRGRALIINNKTFFVDHLSTRDGTEVDVDALRKLFRYLHYDTDVISNLGANEMKKEIEQESQREEHKKYDSFILFLLSHGTEGAVYGTDGYPLPYKEIKTILNNKNCPGLRGKPKMIFIQACQGQMRDSGAFPEGHTAQQPQQAPHATNLDGEQPDASHEIPQTSNEPTMSDFLEVHATSPEYVSWRHTEKGTWFVQTIVDIFSRYAHELDVLQMLVNVNEAISQKQTSKGNKQAPQIVTSLRKKVFFNITQGEQE